jgi:hypothetical protein
MQMRGGIFSGRAKFYGVSALSRHGRTVAALRNLAKVFSAGWSSSFSLPVLPAFGPGCKTVFPQSKAAPRHGQTRRTGVAPVSIFINPFTDGWKFVAATFLWEFRMLGFQRQARRLSYGMDTAEALV